MSTTLYKAMVRSHVEDASTMSVPQLGSNDRNSWIADGWKTGASDDKRWWQSRVEMLTGLDNRRTRYGRALVWTSVLITEYSLCIGQIPLGSTRLVSTRHDSSRVHAFWLCRASRTAQLDSLDTTSSTRSTGSTRQARLARHVKLDWLD